MKYFLGKSEPDHDYSIDDLAEEGRTRWDDIHNHAALKAVSTMSPGDLMFVYHSGKQRAIVGLAKVDSEPFPNPDDPTNYWTVYVTFVKKYENPLELARFKANPLLKDFALVRQSRLSTMAVPDDVATWILENIS